MSKAIQDVLPAALALTASERAELAAELLASLDGEPDADVETAWGAEIRQRAERVLSGDAEARPWSEVYADARRVRE